MDHSHQTIKKEMRRLAAATINDEMEKAAKYEKRGYTPEEAAIHAHVDIVIGERRDPLQLMFVFN